MSTEAFSNLERVIFEQVDVIENTCKAKLSKNISPDSLQNPSDSDATYRKKYKDNVGYVANVAEAINDETGVIRYYDFKPNRYSDSKFADDVIEKMNEEIKSKNQDKIQLIVDGSYYSQDKADAAKEINIEIIPTELVGKKPSDKKIPYSKFIVDKESNMIIQCPNGHIPEESYFSNSSYTAKFDIRICDKCQNKNMCPFKKQKKFNVVRFSEKRYNTDLQREKMNDKEYIELANKRAGVEGIPSVLRRRYDVDTMPVRGLLRSKLWFGFKILAYNIKKLLKSVKATGYSPVFMRIISQLLVNIRGILNVIKMHNQLA